MIAHGDYERDDRITDTFIDRVLDGYIIAALWADARGDDPDGEPGGREGTHVIHHEDALAMRRRVSQFCHANADDVLQYMERLGGTIDLDACQRVGFDLRLTAEGHGTGFWDHGLGSLGGVLTDAAKAFGTFDAFESDDPVVRFDHV